jgi:glycosyltransferase involved in cell wall biosynthesis
LFSPGGNAPPGFAPLVAMSRNLLPFQWRELRRYGLSWMSVRLLLLRFGQTRSFERAQGVIFLSRYAQAVVQSVARIRGSVAVVPHGVEQRFRKSPRPQRALRDLSTELPLRLLYVSIVDLYKHQCQVAEAVARIRAAGLPVVIDFVGPAYPPALRRFRATLARLDPSAEFLRYRGRVPFEKLHALTDDAELFVFASSCENMPNALLEAMAAGLPIACARRGPMEEILGDAGAYFDPESIASIEQALRELIADAGLRARCAEAAHARASAYSWEKCASETFAFLREIALSAGRS